MLKKWEGKRCESEQEISFIYGDICEIFATRFGVVWNCLYYHWTSFFYLLTSARRQRQFARLLHSLKSISKIQNLSTASLITYSKCWEMGVVSVKFVIHQLRVVMALGPFCLLFLTAKSLEQQHRTLGPKAEKHDKNHVLTNMIEKHS